MLCQVVLIIEIQANVQESRDGSTDLSGASPSPTFRAAAHKITPQTSQYSYLER